VLTRLSAIRGLFPGAVVVALASIAEITLAQRGLHLAALECSRVGEPKATIDTLHSFG